MVVVLNEVKHTVRALGASVSTMGRRLHDAKRHLPHRDGASVAPLKMTFCELKIIQRYLSPSYKYPVPRTLTILSDSDGNASNL